MRISDWSSDVCSSDLTYDIAISGAGPVGSTLALMLARKSPQPGRIALIGRHLASGGNPANKQDAAIDTRTLALNHGSRVLLEQLTDWPQTSAGIQTVHVYQRGRLGRSLIRHDEQRSEEH